MSPLPHIFLSVLNDETRIGVLLTLTLALKPEGYPELNGVPTYRMGSPENGNTITTTSRYQLRYEVLYVHGVGFSLPRELDF
jgi:hypothetical protein